MAGSPDPWFASGLRFECRQCGSCCGGFPGFVWVSEEEADAIAGRLGLSRGEFLRQYCKRVGSRFTLREVSEFDCVMLEEGRCRVYSLRPVQCRTFPFWSQNLRSRASWDAAASKCHGMNRGRLHTLEEIERQRTAKATTDERG